METAKLQHELWLADDSVSFARRTKNKDLPPPPIWPLEVAAHTPRCHKNELIRSSIRRRGTRGHGAPHCWPKSQELHVGQHEDASWTWDEVLEDEEPEEWDENEALSRQPLPVEYGLDAYAGTIDDETWKLFDDQARMGGGTRGNA